LRALIGDVALTSGSAGRVGRAFINWGTLFFNFNCLAGDIGFGASIGEPERGIARIAVWLLDMRASILSHVARVGAAAFRHPL
jgi:hypothetical protein